jgi:hypothetical protein
MSDFLQRGCCHQVADIVDRFILGNLRHEDNFEPDTVRPARLRRSRVPVGNAKIQGTEVVEGEERGWLREKGDLHGFFIQFRVH